MTRATHSGGEGVDRPRYDDSERDQAARFIHSDASITPLVRGMEDPDVIRTWTEVAAELNDREAVATLNERLAEVRDDG